MADGLFQLPGVCGCICLHAHVRPPKRPFFVAIANPGRSLSDLIITMDIAVGTKLRIMRVTERAAPRRPN